MADLATTPPLTRASVLAARDLIAPHVHLTPVLTNTTLSTLASTPRSPEDLAGTRWEGRTPAKPQLRLWFKCENLQRVGAFKPRGAFHAVERLKREPGWVEGGGMQKGVVTHSSGNFAQALSLAARESGIPAHIIMPSISNPLKIAATRSYGANVIFSGSTAPERDAMAKTVIADTGARFVPSYDHPDIILGQGTMGLEMQEQVAEQMTAKNGTSNGSSSSSSSSKKKGGLDAIIAPCGGGGMLSGIALSAEGTGLRIFGAEPMHQGADDAKRGFYSSERVPAVSSLTIADGLRTPLGTHTWAVIGDRQGRNLVHGMYSVTEDEILAAMRLVFERMKLVVEPSACVPLAAVLFDEEFRAAVEAEAGEDGWDLGVVFSGGNVGVEKIAELFAKKESS